MKLSKFIVIFPASLAVATMFGFYLTHGELFASELPVVRRDKSEATIWFPFWSCDVAQIAQIMTKLPKDRQQDMHVTQSFTNTCRLPGDDTNVFSGQIFTIFFRVSQRELDRGGIEDLIKGRSNAK